MNCLVMPVLTLLAILNISWINAQEFKREPEERPYEPLYAKINHTEENKYNLIEDFEFLSIENDIRTKISQMLEECQYLCPYDGTDSSFLDQIPFPGSFDQSYCLTEVKFQPYDVISCITEVEPLIIKEKEKCKSKINENDIFEGTLYSFVYKVCDFDDEKKLRLDYSRIYSFCYHKNNVLYTRHEILRPLLLKHIDLLGKLANYHSSTYSVDGYNVLNKDFEQMAKEYESTERKDVEFHMLIPPEDMAIGHWKKATYHYANIRQTTKGNNNYWKTIDGRIRTKAMNMNIQLEIHMGQFTLFVNDNEISVWIKIVLDEESQQKGGITIMLFDDDYPEDKNFCDNKECFTDETIEEKRWLRCCTVTQKHADFFGKSVNELAFMTL